MCDKNFTKIFGQKTLNECFNRKAALYLQLHISDYIKDKAKAEHAKAALDMLIQKSIGSDTLEVTYAKGKSSDDMGRWFSSFGLQRINKRIRHTICKGRWIDLDFVNCHPVILYNISKKYSLKCKYLKRYVENRNEMLQEFMKADGLKSMGDAKTLILKAMNGAELPNYKVEWWHKFNKQLQRINEAIATHGDFQEHLTKCETDKGKTNLYVRTVNRILCINENKCLEILYKFLEEKGCILDNQCALIFDGLMIRDTPEIRATVYKEGEWYNSIKMYYVSIVPCCILTFVYVQWFRILEDCL